MYYRISRCVAETTDGRSLAMRLRSVEAIVLHTSCDRCRFKRSGGMCADRTSHTYRQLIDDSPRLCYDVPHTLHESLVLYSVEHENEHRARGKA